MNKANHNKKFGSKDKIYIMRPSRHPTISGELKSGEQLFHGVPGSEVPSFCATLDGKPSDRFVIGERYCVACLLSKSPLDIINLYEEIEARLAASPQKFKIVKPATIRKKRRNTFLRAFVRCLRDIIKSTGKLPVNALFVSAPSEALNPEHFLQFLRSNQSVRQSLEVSDITSSHITFKLGEQDVQIGHEHYGAMMFWNKIILMIDEKIKGKELDRSWMIYLDRLPLDRDLTRTKLLASLLDFSLTGRLWVSFCEGRDWQIDLLTDIFVNLCYERFSGKPGSDKKLMLEIDCLLKEMSFENTESKKVEAEGRFKLQMDDLREAAEDFFKQTGDLDAALEAFEKSLVLSTADTKSQETSANYHVLGNLYRTRGNLDRAEAMYKKSLAIEETLGHNEGIASAYGNLGTLSEMRGELDRAEAIYEKSLAIYKALGHKEGMASTYCNLGNLYRTRGELDRAEAMYEKSLAINEALGHYEGIASSNVNLGNLYMTRGDLDRAEAKYEESLFIFKSGGHKEGVASTFGNLGALNLNRGNLDRAENFLKRSLAIEEKLGRKRGMASQYNKLGTLYQMRGDLDRAGDMFEKSQAIKESLGLKDVM